MYTITKKIEFPEFTGIKCNMMPYIQGDSSSIPDIFKPYSKIIDDNYIEKGKIGFLTIDESFVSAGKSQRGYNNTGITRNVHIEVGRSENSNQWGGNKWGDEYKTTLNDDVMALIANSISDTCRIWNTKEMGYTKNGDLSAYIDKYPENSGILLKSGEVAKISIFTPHECINQNHSGNRQFFRIIGEGVKGREEHFTINPMITHE